MGKVSVSMLSADFSHLARSCNMVNESPAWGFHLDIMDGVFVPNISYGFPVIEAIAKHAKKPLDAHLMVVEPSRYYQRYKDSGIDWLTVHYEACPHLNRDLQEIRRLGMKAGIALNPATPVSLLDQAIYYADLVLIMSVNPGFGGQAFIESSYEKIEQLNRMRNEKHLDFLIQVDGGIQDGNAGKLYKKGADILVAGNYVFKAKDPIAAISAIT
ncbi:MAG: ribulose-phosphate 3-epimerase [Bacteroidales bacterium]|jgi:ribulose-phosphate 3-epimerase|nr:ribulose-phosphate 3-epimerase [Bacteroidales bacterium]NLK80415.1 ribulose-phosphate 3-epimerase [Bacteroidales bacterium]HKM30969.1 ribulose-phosphate 3-epimerase [Bacteroidales bacterium]HQB23352.1 ribulose-phosphate 3-epimerase [Bacteroidales bacterium]